MPFPAITTTQQFTVSIAPKDRKGRPAAVEAGSVVWASSDPAVADVVTDAEGVTRVVAQGVGEATISVAADADLGEGVTTIVGQDTVNVSLGTATEIGINAGPVEEQPETPPVEPPIE